MAPLNLWEKMYRMVCHSFMRQAVTSRTPANALSGICAMTGPSTSRDTSSTNA